MAKVVKKVHRQSGQEKMADKIDLARSIANTLSTIEKLSLRKTDKDRAQAHKLLSDLELAIQDGLPRNFDIDKIYSCIQRAYQMSA